PSDAAVALIALDAIVEVSSPGGMRRIPVEEFYLVPNHTPALENVMLPGELITALEIPAGPAQRNATYLKVRDRSSYEFALVSVAAGLEFDGDTIVRARLALGGVGTIPWRVRAAEEALAGKKADADAFRAAAAAAVEGAIPRRDNAFKVELAKRAVVRALETVVRERCRRKTESQRSGTLYGRYAGRARDLCGDRFEYDRARPDSLDRDRFRGDGPRRDQNLHPREHAAFHESGAGFSCRARPFADPDADAERGDRPLRAASRGRRRGDVRSRARRCGSRASRLRGAAAGRGASRSARGDVDTALADAETRIDATYTTPTESHNAMEPHATIAQWSGKRLVVHEPTQWILGSRNYLAKVFELDPDDVHVICPFVGGGFGSKGFGMPHSVLAAMAAREIGRPVKLVLSRAQVFTSAGNRAQTEQRLRLGADEDGRLTAIEHETTIGASDAGWFTEPPGL